MKKIAKKLSKRVVTRYSQEIIQVIKGTRPIPSIGVSAEVELRLSWFLGKVEFLKIKKRLRRSSASEKVADFASELTKKMK